MSTYNPKKNNRRRGLVTVILGALALFIVCGVFLLRGFEKRKSSTSSTQVKASQLLQKTTIPGNVVSERSAIILAPYNGYIKDVFVHLGQRVQKGQALISLTQSIYGSESHDVIFPMRAPFAGTIVQLMAYPGGFFRANDPSNPILRLDDLSRLYIAGAVPEVDYAKIRVGQEALIQLSAIPEITYKGIVQELFLASAGKVSWESRGQVEYTLSVSILNPNPLLKPGMSALVDIITMKKDNVLILGPEYVLREGENYFIFDKKGEKKQIQVGLKTDTQFEILSGLRLGDEVRLIDFTEIAEMQATEKHQEKK